MAKPKTNCKSKGPATLGQQPQEQQGLQQGLQQPQPSHRVSHFN